MNDTTTTQAQTPDPLKEAKEKLQSVDRQWFRPNQKNEAYARWTELMDLAKTLGLQPVFNFDDASNIPENYALGIVPLTRRSDTPGGGLIVHNFAIGAFPTSELIAAHEKGADFIETLIQANLMNKLAVAAKPKEGKTKTAEQLPFSVPDFIISQKRTGELQAWRAVRDPFLARVRKQSPGFANLDAGTFRAILSSSATAEQMFPAVPQSTWRTLLQKMIDFASEVKGLTAGAMQVWLDTRDVKELPTVQDLDVEAIFSDITDDAEDETE